MSKPNAHDYNRVLGKAWQPVSREQDRNVWKRHAATYVRAMYKKWLGRKLTMPIRFTSGNRDTWVRWPSKGPRTVFVNPEKGWQEINHLFSHWLAHERWGDAHSDRHLEIERDGAYLIRRRFLMDEPDPSWKPRVKPGKPQWWLLAESLGIEIDTDLEQSIGVWPPKPILDDEDRDPHYGDHYVPDRRSARQRVMEYAALLAPTQ